jgi:hypothetical protein
MSTIEPILSINHEGTRLEVDGPLLAETDPAGHRELLDWCVTHGLDPHQMIGRQTIERDLKHCRIVYDLLVRDEHTGRLVIGDHDNAVVRRVHAQGETPPLPWPSILGCRECTWVETPTMRDRFPRTTRVPCEEHR